MARLFGQKLIEAWGQQVIVDNRPAQPGDRDRYRSEGTARRLHVAGDHHYACHRGQPSEPALRLIKDFAPVAGLSEPDDPVLNPSPPASNLREFIALAKARPGQLNYATTGSGRSPTSRASCSAT
jgi:tripartite-type tricarboxylate transporter receptor subunit TctC